MYISLWENYRGHHNNISFKQFSTKIDGFEQKDSQGFENSYNSYEQYPLEKFFIFTIYQNYTLALSIINFCLFPVLSQYLGNLNECNKLQQIAMCMSKVTPTNNKKEGKKERNKTLCPDNTKCNLLLIMLKKKQFLATYCLTYRCTYRWNLRVLMCYSSHWNKISTYWVE